MNKSISKMAIAVMVLAALVALAMPASASGDPGAGCDCDTVLHDTINGNVYFEQLGYMEKPMEKTFTVPSGTIKEARIYSGVWQGSPGKGGYFNMKIENNDIGTFTTDTYQACDPCSGSPCESCQDERCDILNNAVNMPHNQNLDLVNMHGYTVGCGVQYYSYDATSYIKPGDNTITVTTTNCPTCPNGQWDGRIYLIALLVVYEDGSSETTYWVNEGALYLEKGSGCDGPDDHLYASKYFDGTHVSSPTGVKLWSLGWPHVINGSTTLNGNNLGTPTISEGYAGGYNEVMVKWNDIPPGYLHATSNFLEYNDPNPLYERAFVEVLLVESADLPDLVVTDIAFPTMMKPGASTITATVTNQGPVAAGASHARLNIDGSPSGTPVAVGGLGPAGSTTVNFPVNLAEDCYDFEVVADCNGAVTEGDENNNAKTEEYQVGYYIVVDGNAGFAALVPLGYATGSGTSNDPWIIDGHDLENCAGPGIDIQNTDEHFVISNCNIHDCDDCGIFCRNGMNGEITGNTVEDNHMKGIKLQKCSYIDVENNIVQDNTEYGIDVYMEVMPTVDSEYITITGNTLIGNEYGIEMLGDNCIVCGNIIQNSDAYGMYMFGNGNEVYNNIIENSGDYGMKLDDSPTTPCLNNHLYRNDFINNGGAGAQAYDSGTANTWNTPTMVDYCYSGTPQYGYVGNYWDDYTGSDTNGNGIGTPAYALAGGSGATDSYPAMVKWRLCGDANRDGGVNMMDTGAVFGSIFHPGSVSICNSWAADVNCDESINMMDAGAIIGHVFQDIPLNGCCQGC